MTFFFTLEKNYLVDEMMDMSLSSVDFLLWTERVTGCLFIFVLCI